MKALDIVRTPKGGVGFITETNDSGVRASIVYIDGLNEHNERNAWWNEGELEVLSSIPKIIATATAHPFGTGKKDVELYF